jgi:hypothetical protein
VKTDAEPLTMTVHSLPEATLHDQAQRTRIGRAKMMLILLVCAAPVIASYVLHFAWRPSGPGTAYGALIQPTVGLPDLTARQLDGNVLPLRALKGQWLLVLVGPAACDRACEERLFLQRQLREMVGRDRERIDKIWLITDEAPLRPELQQALTAGRAPVTVLRVPLGAVSAWLQPAPGHTIEEHVYVVDPMGEWMMRAPVKPEPSKLKRDLERLLRASASWDLPGR